MATGQMMVGLVARLRRSAPQAGIQAKDYAREVARAGAQHRLRDCGELDYASCACAQNTPLAYSGGSSGFSASSVALRRSVSLSVRFR